MSGIGDQGMRADDVISPGDPDAQERIREHLHEHAQEKPDGDAAEEVPAGGSGADSGAADAVGIDPGSESSVPDESVHNAEPGVGTRRADDTES
ncbi:hypothetical protein RS84_01842 [Microbacterium hydrocarbonoxydans]|jgi:hypothetical protein|uniref:Uncharacterized protein n=1 Tax=Microbacterium hydrocarbonoxydans TaxID=273678 RepID=A0A0M2HTH7_9MICO|nr:hypothetical protein [Microbacterium hydrocarbonoxydans]KJL48210.1 hypothetical protein RS84_01842 [Microbacterium hydrocarbonoxydans]